MDKEFKIGSKCNSDKDEHVWIYFTTADKTFCDPYKKCQCGEKSYAPNNTVE
jgi:hypothetical protein